MNLLTAEKISRNFTDKVVLNQVSLGINKNDKIGVIGVNGTGKSTLLKILAGKEEPDEGRVVKGNDVRIEYLAQTPEFDDKYTVLENVIKSHEHASDGWNVEGEAKVMLGKLGITDWNEKPSNLSGGQRKRAALVRTLLTPADILILDEPTNHLDNAMAEWLEDYLNRFNGAFIMITHDRYFLDKVTNKIVEIDKGNLYTYETNYSGFLELKLEREEMELATERKKKALYRQDLAWIMRGARARSTKQKAHIQRFEELRDREKIEEVKNVEITALASRLGKKTIELKDICKAFDEKILIKDFSYIFLKTDRIGIVGGNGAGKSTFLRVLSGVYKPDKGYAFIDGLNVYENPKAKQKIVFVADDLYFLPGATLNKMAKLYASAYDRFDWARFKELTKLFGLDPKKSISNFSKGMKRQAAIILALSTRTKYMFFDETFDGLDPVMRNLVKKLICNDVAELNSTVIVTSHSLRELEDICDHLALLHKGGMVLDSDVLELKTSQFKVQVAFRENFDKSRFEQFNITRYRQEGSVANMIINGDREETVALFKAMNPLVLDVLPLTLEEVFTYEMESLGYEFESALEVEK